VYGNIVIMSDLVNILLLSLLGGVVALLGGMIFLFVGKWSVVLGKYSVPFAAGVLVTVALVGLLPEMVHEVGEDGFLIVLVTFFGAYLFEQFACSLHHHDHDHGGEASCIASVPLVVIGDVIHNFIDGVAIAASYLVSPGLGLVTAVSTLLHEVPHEIGDFGILLKAGWRKRKILVVNLVSALFTVIGALMVYFMDLDRSVIGYLLAVAAGMFLYLGASDFLPHANEGASKRKMVLVLLLGVVIMYGALKIVPHSG
jgi:zinc and cadmium transporter